MSILIVEDDDGVGETLASILREEGYLVETASNGEAALRIIADARSLPSLILLDLMMPQMDGIHFRTRQLADPALRAIPVVIISARPDVALRAAELHADDFLQKPMSFEELLHVVQNRAITEVGAAE
jgi:DNA-binding response OmpR family regulator